MKNLLEHWLFIVIGAMLLTDGLLTYTIYREWPVNYVTVAVLNVGSGNAVYIESPTHERLLIDSGPDHTILGQVSKFLPFYTRRLDAVLLTGSSSERGGGLTDILETYKVSDVLTGITRGTTINFGDGTDLTVIFPDSQKYPQANVLGKLRFGLSSVLLTNGEPALFEDYILAREGTSTLQSDVVTTFYINPRQTPSKNFIQAISTQEPVSEPVSEPVIFHCSRVACIQI